MAKSVSTVDLLLAGRVMYSATKPLLVTGNKKDFPTCIFDTLTTFNVEHVSDGSMQTFCVIEFNKNKFDNCLEELNKII